MSCCSQYARITSGLSKYRSYVDVLSSESEPASPPANARTRAESVVSSSCMCVGINGSFSPTAKKKVDKERKRRKILCVSEVFYAPHREERNTYGVDGAS